MYELDASQLEAIKQAGQIETLKKQPGWALVRKQMENWRESALHAIEGCKSSTPSVRSLLLLRYQERNNLLRGMDDYIEAVAATRSQILREFAEFNGIDPEEVENALEGQI